MNKAIKGKITISKRNYKLYHHTITHPCKKIISENTRVNSVETCLGSILYFFIYSKSSTLDPSITMKTLIMNNANVQTK